MKRVMAGLCAIALCASLCACGGPTSIVRVGENLFERVELYNDAALYRHKDTNVLYAYKDNAFTVLLNADGTPMMWEGH